MKLSRILPLFFCVLCSTSFASSYQDSRIFGGEWYISWGYNKDYWTPSDIHVVQPGINSNFIVYSVRAGDQPGWDESPPSLDFAAQYSIRIGRFIDAQHNWAIELNFDHTKYNSYFNQVAFVGGTVNGQPIMTNLLLTPNSFDYRLHNGVNHIMLNAVRRVPLEGIPNQPLSVAAIFRFGAGFLLPHAENMIFGNHSNVGPKASGNYIGWSSGWWQYGGWTIGVEAGARIVLYKPLYLEITDKETFNDIYNIPVYQGRADQTVWMNEVIFSLGLTT